MTRIQIVVVIALVILIVAIAAPKAIQLSKFSRAEHDILTIAAGFVHYRDDTGQECQSIQDLMKNPGVAGWLGPYINQKAIRNPWGGQYAIDREKQKVGIPKGDAAPDRYEFGGSEEISFSYSKEMNP